MAKIDFETAYFEVDFGPILAQVTINANFDLLKDQNFWSKSIVTPLHFAIFAVTCAKMDLEICHF